MNPRGAAGVADAPTPLASGSPTSTEENVANVDWREARFFNTSRLRNEPADGVPDIVYTPGNPRTVMGGHPLLNNAAPETRGKSVDRIGWSARRPEPSGTPTAPAPPGCLRSAP